MNSIIAPFLESWDRQVAILTNLAGRIDETNKFLKPSEDGRPIFRQLAHIHMVRLEWVGSISKAHADTCESLVTEVDGTWVVCEDLEKIREQLAKSAQAVRDSVSSAIEAGTTRIAPYDHPVFMMQHMIWHEGWHFALIMLALRNGGQEPDDEWEERNVWGIWRDPEI